MAKCLLLVAAVVVPLSITSGQSPTRSDAAPPEKPKFEVASVKECKPGDQDPPSTSSPGRLSLSCWPLSRLIADAYETFADGKVDPLKLAVAMPLEGTPSWANAARYTIDAKAEGPQSGAIMRGPMMQALLEDRFHVKVHREAREIAGYVMTVDKGGLKLKPTQEGSCGRVDPTDLSQPSKAMACNLPRIERNGPLVVFDIRGVGLDAFAQLLHPDGRPVLDRSGVTGAFDIHLEWEPEVAASMHEGRDAPSDPSPHASQIEAMRRQLGLRLDPGRGTREMLVIDHVERPSAN